MSEFSDQLVTFDYILPRRRVPKWIKYIRARKDTSKIIESRNTVFQKSFFMSVGDRVGIHFALKPEKSNEFEYQIHVQTGHKPHRQRRYVINNAHLKKHDSELQEILRQQLIIYKLKS